MPDKPNKNAAHPVRFTVEQIEFIKHMIIEKGYEFWEEESVSLIDTIDLYEFWV